jgi:hypothetical protein
LQLRRCRTARARNAVFPLAFRRLSKATARAAEFLFRKATTEGPQCVTAAIFWMKTRGGWKETGPPEPVVQP